MNRNRYLALVFLSVFSLPSIAGVWTPLLDVNTVYMHNAHGGYLVLGVSDTSTNPDSCNAVWYVVSKQENPVFSEIYSLMLTAHATGKQIKVWIEGCSPHNHPVIQHAKLFQ